MGRPCVNIPATGEGECLAIQKWSKCGPCAAQADGLAGRDPLLFPAWHKKSEKRFALLNTHAIGTRKIHLAGYAHAFSKTPVRNCGKEYCRPAHTGKSKAMVFHA